MRTLAQELSDTLGIRVYITEAVKPGQVMILGNWPKPDGWDQMSHDEQLVIAIRYGAELIIRPEYAHSLLVAAKEGLGQSEGRA